MAGKGDCMENNNKIGREKKEKKTLKHNRLRKKRPMIEHTFCKALLCPFSSSLKPSTVSLTDSITLRSDSARNLGFILDLKLSMRKACHKNVTLLISNLNALVQSAGFSLKTQPKLLLLPISSHGLTTATVSSWVHLTLSSNLFRKFQNFAARLVLLAPRHRHLIPLLEKLHWLPISERIKYKVACMCFSAINGSWSCLPL